VLRIYYQFIYCLSLGIFYVKEYDKLENFCGFVEKLKYWIDLGINSLDIMPAFEFAGDYPWAIIMLIFSLFKRSMVVSDTFKTSLKKEFCYYYRCCLSSF